MNAIMQNFDKIFNASLIYATFRSATPIIFAALCAAITQQANILNIGTEGIMLVGAFTAVAVTSVITLRSVRSVWVSTCWRWRSQNSW